MDNHEDIKHVVDATGIVVTLGSLMDLLPKVLTLLMVIWYLIRIGEWVYGKIKGKKHA
jgi:hypothetical protein